MEYSLLIFTVLSFIAACNCQFSFKYGAEWTEHTIIPQNSFLRKIYPFKESKINPLKYVKLIPFYISCVILISVFIVYIVYWVSPSLLLTFLQSKLVAILSFIYFLITFIYYIILEIDFKS